MSKPKLPTISPQAGLLYQLLLKEGPLTIKASGEKMGLLPQGVYRLARILEQFGCLKFVNKYPFRLVAKLPSEAIQTYLLVHHEWFLSNFQTSNEAVKKEKTMEISFVQNRQESLERTTEDLNLAKSEADFWVSGFEVPAETILAIKKAIERGVKVKIIAQVMNHTNQTMFNYWQQLGIQVKVSKLVETRIILFDSEIVYLSTFNPKKREQSLGVRLKYQPIAQLVHSLFSEQWEKAKDINDF